MKIKFTITDVLKWLNPVGPKTRLGILILLLAVFVVSSTRAQYVTGTGTPNTIPQFTSMTTVGDSPIVQYNGNIGIGSTTPTSRLEVFDFRQTGGDANGAVFGQVNCTSGNTSPACAGLRGDASNISFAAVGVLGDNFADDAGGGSGVRGQVFGTNGVGVFGVSATTTGNSPAVLGEAASPASPVGLFINTGGALSFKVLKILRKRPYPVLTDTVLSSPTAAFGHSEPISLSRWRSKAILTITYRVICS